MYQCPKCNQEIAGKDHPSKHHTLCPISNLAKKDKKGGFAK